MIQRYRTSKRSDERVTRLRDICFSKKTNFDLPCVYVDSKKTYQTHLGFGGALTEASSLVLDMIGPELRKEVIEAYYGQNGNKYNFLRLTINSCDFGLTQYSYVEDHDYELRSFSLKHDEELIIPFALDIKNVSQLPLFIVASPWSAPWWMKDNLETQYGGKLLGENYQLWADYFVKYLKGMENHGLTINAVTVQNEPEAKQIWESMHFTALEEAKFVRNYLSPSFKKNKLGTNIIIWDHNKDHMVQRSNVVLEGKKNDSAVWGIGYHWYCSEAFKNIELTHHLYPNQHIIFTEGCVEVANEATGNKDNVYLGDWKHAETYGRNIILGLNNYTEAWIDWNLILDEVGGPTYVKNFCESPIMYDRRVKKLIYNGSYYYLAHFSRFIEVGAKRLFSSNDLEKDVFNVAYQNPNGDIVIVIQNENWIKELTLIVDSKSVNITLPPNSITTFVLKK